MDEPFAKMGSAVLLYPLGRAGEEQGGITAADSRDQERGTRVSTVKAHKKGARREQWETCCGCHLAIDPTMRTSRAPLYGRNDRACMLVAATV